MLSSLDDLVRMRQRWGRLMTGQPSEAAEAAQALAASPLEEDLDFAADALANPGNLRLLAYVPPGLPAGAPLVVALHGCKQTATGYEHGCGWAAMARRHGFALLVPEQPRDNNPNHCFNWFEAADTTRDSGEVQSIRQMIDRLQRRHRLDPARCFISGLSAGGGMTAAMLACYPEVFAGGAIVAGLPYAAARGVSQAFEAMYQPSPRSAAERSGAVLAASAHRGPWPRVSIWQGDGDDTVKPANAAELVKQWVPLHGLDPAAPTRREETPRFARQEWRDAAGRLLVESVTVPGLGHGVPLYPGEGEGRAGEAGPYLLDAGLSSTHAILDFWGIPVAAARPAPAGRPSKAHGVIAKVLRATGLR